MSGRGRSLRDELLTRHPKRVEFLESRYALLGSGVTVGFGNELRPWPSVIGPPGFTSQPNMLDIISALRRANVEVVVSRVSPE